MQQPLPGFLTSEQRKQLLYECKREKKAVRSDRYKTILLLDKGWKYEKIAEALFLDHTTIRRYLEAFLAGGVETLTLLRYQGGSTKLSKKQEEELKSHLREKTYLSASEVSSYIKKTFSVTYTTKGVVNLLHRLGFAYKKPKLVPGKADAEKQAAFLNEYEKLKANKKADEEILFVDGVHPQHNSRPAYGWIEKGYAKELQSNSGRKRVNINGALNPETLEVISREDESINAQSTVELIKQVENHYPEAPKITLISDNARYYKSKIVQEYLRNSRVELKFLPPYSPNLNLIERLWRFFHKKVSYNKYYETFSSFKNAVYEFFESIPLYRSELETLLVQKFHIINSQTQVA